MVAIVAALVLDEERSRHDHEDMEVVSAQFLTITLRRVEQAPVSCAARLLMSPIL